MKTSAIKHARANVTLANMGNQWRVDTYSSGHRAWREGVPSDYWSARASYSQALIDSARAFLGLPEMQYDGGVWEEYINPPTLSR
jgi:hypothetical protein